jgi:hypothetical protein
MFLRSYSEVRHSLFSLSNALLPAGNGSISIAGIAAGLSIFSIGLAITLGFVMGFIA